MESLRLNMGNPFDKQADGMMPFSKSSVWNFADNLGPKTISAHPTVIGSTVLGLTYDKGVVICADTLCSYGSLARFKSCERVFKVNDQVILGVGGDYADFQFVWNLISQQVTEERCFDDGFIMKPRSLHCWLTRMLYNRRSKLDPLWNYFIIGGMEDGVPFLGVVDKIGMAYEAPTIATGFGSYLALPVLRTAHEEDSHMSEEKARDLMIRSMKVLFCRDKSAFQKYTMATVTASGVKIEGPNKIEVEWEHVRVTADK